MNKELTKLKYFPFLLAIVQMQDIEKLKKLLESLKVSLTNSEYDQLPEIELTKEEMKLLVPQLSKSIIEEGVLSYSGILVMEKRDSEDSNPFCKTPYNLKTLKAKTLYSLNIRKFVVSLLISNNQIDDLEEKMNLLWDMYDLDKDGNISISEMEALLCNFNVTHYLCFDRTTIEEIAKILFEKLDPEERGFITKDSFRNHFHEFKGKSLFLNFFEQQQAKTCTQSTNIDKENDNEVVIGKYKAYCLLNFKSMIWTAIYILSNAFWAGLFLYNFYNPNLISLAIAKFFAALILWNMCLLLLFACENFFTLFSRTWLYSFLPLENLKYYHKISGIVFCIASLGHTLAHLLGTYMVISSEPDVNKLNPLLVTKLDKPVSYFYLVFETVFGVTGIMLVVCLILIYVTTLKKVKQYEVFWYFHKLYYLVYILVFFHGMARLVANPVYWKFIIGPGIIFIFELIIEIYRFFFFKTKIISVKLIENNVIELIVSKPKLFTNRPGQYAKVCIPDISSFQYHPLTIASATHHTNLVLYISPVGYWTKTLTKIAKQFLNNNIPLQDLSRSSEIDLKELKRKTHYLFYEQKPIENVMINPYCRIDGPFGAPCERYEQYKHLLFIAGGIGVTPFASILFSLLHDIKNGKVLPYESIQLVWVVREFSSAVWMINLIKRLLTEDVDRIFKISLNLTNTKQACDLRSFFLWHGLDLLKKEKKDRVSDYCDIFSWGRPNWRQILRNKRITMEEKEIKDNVGIFVCADYSLCKDVYFSCIQFSGEGINFIYHKENFD